MLFRILFVLFFSYGIVSGQISDSRNDELLLRIHCKRNTAPSGKCDHITHRHRNPLNWLLVFYKKVLSAQISASCDFEPSCSAFSGDAIHEFGFIRGVLMTADRLTRCNGFASDETVPYLINHSNAKTKDDPRLYRFNK